MSKESVSRREALRAQQEAQAKAARTRKLIGIGVGLMAVVLAAVMIVVGIGALNSGQSNQGTWYPPNVTETKDGVTLFAGQPKAGAPTIDVYVDFQCPICKVSEEKYVGALQELAAAGDIRVVQHTLTFMDGNLRNTASSRAANAATCSDAAGQYAAMTAAIFSRQEQKEVVGSVGYSDTLLRETLPAQVGITGEALTTYQQCYDRKLPADFLEELAEASYNKGITGTPTYTRNGVKLAVNAVGSASVPETTVAQFKTLVLNGQ